MKVSHEVPRCLLTASPEFNDYDYCLPHLLDQDEVYKQYFYDAKKTGRYIIMDNSLHELGEAYNHKRLIHWVKELEPDEFIVPDVWMNMSLTCAQAKYWKQFEYPENTTPVAVVQGKDDGDAYKCFRILSDLKYKKIAISYGATWYNNLFPHVNKDLGKALGRLNFVSRLFSSNVVTKYDRIHLLGCSVPQEFGWYRGFDFIESIDTSNPVMAALEGTMYNESGLIVKPKANMNDHFNMDFCDIEYELVIHNTTLFREINGIPKIEHYG